MQTVNRMVDTTLKLIWWPKIDQAGITSSIQWYLNRLHVEVTTNFKSLKTGMLEV
jgi:hypothetical protein